MFQRAYEFDVGRREIFLLYRFGDAGILLSVPFIRVEREEFKMLNGARRMWFFSLPSLSVLAALATTTYSIIYNSTSTSTSTSMSSPLSFSTPPLPTSIPIHKTALTLPYQSSSAHRNLTFSFSCLESRSSPPCLAYYIMREIEEEDKRYLAWERQCRG